MLQTKQLAAAAAILAAAGCARKLAPPTAAFDAPVNAHVRVRVQLDGSKSAPAPVPQGETPVPIVFHWDLFQKPAGSASVLEETGGPRPRFLPDLPGTYAVRLFIADFAHESKRVDQAIVASLDCTPLVVRALISSQATSVGRPVSLSGELSSPCNDPAAGVGGDPIVSVLWTLEGAPSGSRARIVGPDRLDASFTPDLRGVYNFSLSATDALGFTSPAVHVGLEVGTCGANAPQVDSLTPEPFAPNLGQAVRLSAAVSDADAQPPCNLPRTLVYSWSLSSVPAGSHAALSDEAAQVPSFTPDVAGDYVVSLEVRDDLGRKSARRSLSLTASACGGGVPMVTATGPGNVAAGAPAQLHAAVQNSDFACGLSPSHALLWQIVAAPASASARLNDYGLENPSFTPDVPGTWTFSVVATASTGKVSDAAQVTVQVDPCGSVPPVVVAVAPAGAATGQPILLGAQVTDANACKTFQPFTYRWTLAAAPAGSLARLSGAGTDQVSSQAAPGFVPDLSGSYTAQVVVTDALGLASAPASVTFTAARCNAPLTAPIAAPAGAATGAPLQATAQVSDPNDPALCGPGTPYSFAWALVGVPTGSTAALNNPAAAAPSFTPDQPGTYTLQLVVTDALGNRSLRSSADVSVAGCTAPLTASIAPASGPTGLPLALAAAVSDPNDPAPGGCTAATTPLRYSWSFAALPAGSQATLNNAGAASPSFVPDVAGSYVVALQVTDAAGNRSAQVTGTVAVSDCAAPLTAAIVAPAGAATGAPVGLAANVNEPNTGAACAATAPLSYRWTLTGKPQGSAAALNQRASSSPSFTPDLAGSYSVTLVVTDAAGNRSNLAAATINVASCTAPLTVALASSGSATQGLVAVTATVTEPNTGGSCAAFAPISVAWTLTAAPSGSRAGLDVSFVSSGSLAPSTSFTPDKPGAYVVSLRAADALGNTGTASSTINVSGCGGGSTVGVRISASPASPEEGQRVVAAAAVSDTFQGGCGVPTVAPFSYAWFLKPAAGGKAVLDDATAARPAFVPDAPGGWELGATVTDALGNQGSGSISVPVLDCTLTPAIGAFASAQPTFTTVQLTGSATTANPACTTLPRYAWSFDTRPVGSRAQLNDPSVRTPSFTPDVPNGAWILRLTVTDPRTGAQAQTTGAVTSNACGSQLPFATAGISLPFPISQSSPQPDPTLGSTVQYLPGYQLQIDGTRSQDPSAACTGPLAFDWTVYERPPSSVAQLGPTNAAKPVFSPDVTGDYIFQLKVSDGRFTSDPSYLRISVFNKLQDLVSVTGRHVVWNDSAADPITGLPSLAYLELNAAGTQYDAKFTRCTANCNTATPTWTAPILVEANVAPSGAGQLNTFQISLKYLPGTSTPVVAYRNSNSCFMRYGALAAGVFTMRDVENIGAGCSSIHGEIQLLFAGAAQKPALAYHTHNPSTGARYAVCTANCSSAVTAPTWKFQFADSNGNAGHYLTAFVDPISFLPRLGYQVEVSNTGPEILRYATCADGVAPNTCDNALGTWTTVDLENTAGSAYWNSMAIAPAGAPNAGKPAIAYEDASTNAVRLAVCTANCGSAATSVWNFQTVITPTAGNYFTTLQYDSAGLAHITYIDPTPQTLRYAIQRAPGTATSWQFFDIDTGVDDGHSSFILTALGSTHVSYSLTTGLKYYPFGD